MWRFDVPDAGSPSPPKPRTALDEQRAVYRACMIEWLDSVHEALGVSLASFMHAVVLMDRFMLTEHARVDRFTARAGRARADPACGPFGVDGACSDDEACAPVDGETECLPLVSDDQLQLVAMTCLLVAAKLVEDEMPSEFDSLRRLCELAGHGRYHWTELRGMEAALCRRLRWRLGAPSPLGELRKLVLAGAAAPRAAPPPLKAALLGVARAGLGGRADGASDASEDDEIDVYGSPRAPRAAPALILPAADGSGASDAPSFHRLVTATRRVPLRARAAAEVGAFLLQACLYSRAGVFDDVPADVLAEAALRAAERHATQACLTGRARGSSVDSAASEGGLSDAPTRSATPACTRRGAEGSHPIVDARARLVDRLAASMREVITTQCRGLTPVDGIAHLGADANRWELPRCLASKRRFASARPTRALDVGSAWCGRASRHMWPLYALHDALPAEQRAVNNGARAFGSARDVAGVELRHVHFGALACAAPVVAMPVSVRAQPLPRSDEFLSPSDAEASDAEASDFEASDVERGSAASDSLSAGMDVPSTPTRHAPAGDSAHGAAASRVDSPLFVLQDVHSPVGGAREARTCASRASIATPRAGTGDADGAVGAHRAATGGAATARAERPHARPNGADGVREAPLRARSAAACAAPRRAPLCARSFSSESDASVALTHMPTPRSRREPSERHRARAAARRAGEAAKPSQHDGGKGWWWQRSHARQGGRARAWGDEQQQPPAVRASWPAAR